MKQMVQLGLAALVVWAAPSWGQESQSSDPVFATPADLPQVNGNSHPPIISGPVLEPRMDGASELSNATTDMMEATHATMMKTSPPPNPSGPSYDEIRRFHNARCYLSETGSPTHSCTMNARCHSPDCPYCYCEPKSRLARLKAYMQRTHWGYCNYFDERPFGESMHTTLSSQIHRGLEDSMMLYHYDFYPEGSQNAGKLTPRGRVQLIKIVERMQNQSAPIRIQLAEGKPALNLDRRQHVVDSLAMIGTSLPEELVVLAPIRHQGSANEAAPTFENQLQSVISRGRTIQATETSRFGGK